MTPVSPDDESDRLRKRLRLATEVTLAGAWEYDPASGLVGVDARSRELFGVAEGQLATLDAVTSRLHADDRDRVRDAIAGAAGAGRTCLDECRVALPRDGAYRWVAVAFEAHQDAHAPPPRVLGIVHDTTDRRRAEEEHARLVEELARAVRIGEMFAGILDRDLRDPLSAILVGAQLLGHDARDERSARTLSRVVASGERLGRMMEQLLDFTRAGLGEGIPLEREAVDLARLARDVAGQAAAERPASVVRVAAHGDATGAWDRDRVAQVLSGLVGNAIQHGASSGPVEVVVDGTDPARVGLTVRNPGAIPAHVLATLFDPFRGAARRGNPIRSRGLGLGLYVARQIALAHGGELGVESTAAGTAFTLRLPRSAPGAARPTLDAVREEEMAAFERMAAPPGLSVVTAQLFGATPLHERAPLEHADIVERYGALLDTALHRKAYRGQGEGMAGDLRALAERLGDLGAGPREVTEVHARALRGAVRGVTAARTQALLAEGRLLALELMGNLASYYRRRSGGHGRPGGGGA